MAHALTEANLELVAARFKLLGEVMRLRLLNVLRDRELTVSEIVEVLGAGQANVSKHLGLLHREGLLERRKEGLNVYYRVVDPSLFELCELVCEGIESALEEKRRALSGSARSAHDPGREPPSDRPRAADRVGAGRQEKA